MNVTLTCLPELCCRPGNGSVAFQQDDVSCSAAKFVQEQFEEYDKELKVLTRPSICGMFWAN